MSLKYIRDYYKVPAKRGNKICFLKKYYGTIVGSSGCRLIVRINDLKRIIKIHPTWEVEYLKEGDL